MTDWSYVDRYLGLTYGQRHLNYVIDAAGNTDEKAQEIQDLTQALIELETVEILLLNAHNAMFKHIDTSEEAEEKLRQEYYEAENRYLRAWRERIGRRLYRLKFQEGE